MKTVGFIGGMMLAASASCIAQTTSAELKELSVSIARTAAEIERRIADENKRPFKTYITPRTKGVVYGAYYKDVQKRIEASGTENFPQKNGKKMYGELIVYIPIYQDGSLFLRDGGPSVEKSSGNVDLDNAALEIVRRVAPFGPFPPEAISRHKDDLWIIIAPFNFTRQETLPADVSRN